MKRKMLIASWACYVLFPALLIAAETKKPEVFQDTIVMTPDSNVKVIFIGEEMKDMSAYQRIDTVKMMLINDIEKAKNNTEYPADAKSTHYFISAEGRRRLKAESKDYLEQEVDVKKESRSLSLGLHPFAYYIHDLVSGYEIQIYVSDPEKLKSLSNYHLGKAIALAGNKDVYKRNFRSDFEKRDSEWILVNKRRLQQDVIEIVPAFGFGMVGNVWSPGVGIDMRFQLTDKYGNAAYRVGLGLLAYTFTPAGSLDFENINFVNFYKLKFMYNLFEKKADRKWFGLSGGYAKSTEPSMLDKRFTAGVLAEGFGPFSFSFDVIFLKDKKSVYGATLLLPF